MLKNKKTSQKITIFFSIFNVISLVVLLLCINVVYFFIWYTDQKEKSWYDMNINYNAIIGLGEGNTNTEAFKKYILQKDTIIIPADGAEITCSQGVAKKLHNDVAIVDEIKDSLFHKQEGIIYFIFSKEYEDIGEVKVFFDTTSYVEGQILIIKISLIMIFISTILYYFFGNILSHYALRELKNIASKAQKVDLNKNLEKIIIEGPDDDEIKILGEVLNTSFEKIKKQGEDQKQFITDVSHELKTPLMIINSKIDVYNKKCEKGSCGVEEMRELRFGIKNNTKKLNKILETLFLLMRFEGNEVVYSKDSTNISKLVISLGDELAQNREIKRVMDYKVENDIFKEIEASTFAMIFDNLLTNAFKFSPPESSVEVGIDSEKLWVRDFGIGMKKEDAEKVFDKFYRKDQNIEGFGVGLSIVKRITHFYDWRVEVESEEGKGTCFTIYFSK